MERCVRVVVIALVAVFGSCVHAHAAPCQEAAPVRVGDVVACAGLLVPIDQAARAIDCATVTLPELQARSSAELKSCVADYDASRRIAETERNRGARLAVALDKMSATVEPVPLWKHPATWASVGFILGATATIYLMTGFERAQ